MKKYFLWIGGVFSESALLNNSAVSTAANRWQTGLIEALNERRVPMLMLSYLPEPVWPKGKLRPGCQDELDSQFEGHMVHYWNFPFIRTGSLRQSHLKRFREVCETYGNPLAVFSYNPAPWSVSLGLYAQTRLGIPWIDICADHYDPGNNWAQYAPGAKMAKGHMFLSYQAFLNCPSSKKIHLDGGISCFKFDSEVQSTNKKIILYTGMLSVWGGVSFLLKAFAKISALDIELWVCGQGSNADLEAALEQDFRIKFFGLVSESRLQEICKEASVLVNPRPSNVDGNAMNFPSKILEYLSYGKPVISTWTPGLSPEYRNVLEVLGEESEDCLANTIKEVLHWSDEKRNEHSVKIRDFLLEKKTWKQQADRLVDWLEADIL